MAELNLTNEDITELLAILNISLSNVNEQIRNSPDTETLNTFKDHRERVRKWIHRLSQVGFEKASN